MLKGCDISENALKAVEESQQSANQRTLRGFIETGTKLSVTDRLGKEVL